MTSLLRRRIKRLEKARKSKLLDIAQHEEFIRSAPPSKFFTIDYWKREVERKRTELQVIDYELSKLKKLSKRRSR
jgi:hypothetical protein